MEDERVKEKVKTEIVGGRIRSVRDLAVYRKAFDAAMEIFELSNTFPREELYSLTDQIRRSSRSVLCKPCRGLAKEKIQGCLY